MIDLKCCPSTLAEGFGTYSPKASKALFDGRKVSPFLGFSIDGLKKSDEAAKAAGRISVSGVQEKFPAVVVKGVIRLARDGERVLALRPKRIFWSHRPSRPPPACR